MTNTIQILDVDYEVYKALPRRAAELGMMVPDSAGGHPPGGPSEEWLQPTLHRSSDLSARQVLEAFDEMRGAQPDADS